MQRIECAVRPHWQQLAERLGFHFHTLNNAPYWDESAYYQFKLRQIEQDLEAPTAELHQMCMDLVDGIIQSESLLRQLQIPEIYWDYVAHSWKHGAPHIYGRMDFSYSGAGPAKLLELNYDTPTSLYEAAFFQWVWMEDQIRAGVLPADADQFNSIQDALLTRFVELAEAPHLKNSPLYFASVRESIEDKGTTDYLRDIAHQAGIETRYIALEDIGWNNEGEFVDLADAPIGNLFKLYPWEFIFHDTFGPFVPFANTHFFEPAWKCVLSNKGILPLLWQAYPNHPNLLPAQFMDKFVEPSAGWVVKPLLSREGANISLHTQQGAKESVSGPYTDSSWIRQACSPLPDFNNNYALIGSWVIGDEAVGIGVREDASLITQDSSRFIPHIILD
ncbi:MAG TPA: glutathionylspermidine synthase family protein [Pseudomonadales bacterium]|nr:glutathionylspermidine synthase family protein [Pseudomonadales bacterium]